MNQMGYACINMQLSNQKPKGYTGRSMIKRTFTEKGINYASELGLQILKIYLLLLNGTTRMDLSFFALHLIYFPGVVNTS